MLAICNADVSDCKCITIELLIFFSLLDDELIVVEMMMMTYREDYYRNKFYFDE